MATKKAAPKGKRPAAKSATTRKSTSRARAKAPIIVEEENIEVVNISDATVAAAAIDDTPVAKMTFGEKLSALRPGMLIAEFLGTFVLTGLVLLMATQGTIGTIGIALGLAILVMVLGVVSGAHLNPAITIAQYVNRKIDGVKTIAYIIAQVLGALLCLAILTGTMSAQYDYNAEVTKALKSAAGVTEQQISDGGGLDKFLETNYGMTVDTAATQLGVKSEAPKPTNVGPLTQGKEWVTFLMEMLGALVFGLGVGYAVFSKKKSAIETGLAVGVALFAGLLIGGSTVILNPAVASAIGGFEWGGALFGTGAMTFWWPVFIYVFGTCIGMTAGVTIYRFILKDVVAKK